MLTKFLLTSRYTDMDVLIFIVLFGKAAKCNLFTYRIDFTVILCKA